MRSRLVFALVALAVLLLPIAGCGSSSSSPDVAGLAPPGVPVFAEGTLRPSGELKSNTDAIAKQVAGVDNLGEFIVSELESSAEADGEPFDFEKEVEPWLGERAGVFFEQLEGSDLSGTGVVVESTDTGATQEFIDAQVESSDEKYREASYEGVDYEFGGSEENAIGVVGDFLVIAEGEQVFKQVVDASEGESLADEDTFAEAISAASDGSLADVYVDVGGLIEQSGGQIDPQARQILQNAGIDPSEATAVASVIPGSDRVEVDLSSDLGGEKPPSGDASDLLGSLPASSFAAFAVSGFGEQLQEALDSLDAEGIPGTIPPHQLKKGVKELGIDLEGLVDSFQDAAIFAVGNSESSLGGALVLTTKGSEAVEAVDRAVTLLRAFHVGGVTVLGGKTSGFAVHSGELGPKPLVVAAKEGRVAIGYGVPATLTALAAESGKTLSDNPAYGEAVSSLGNTPISGFADGRAALRLANALVPNSDSGFQEAKKYLKSIAFLALGAGSEGELATAKLIVGLK
jgi:Protein of unknown function (DUF3352)